MVIVTIMNLKMLAMLVAPILLVLIDIASGVETRGVDINQVVIIHGGSNQETSARKPHRDRDATTPALPPKTTTAVPPPTTTAVPPPTTTTVPPPTTTTQEPPICSTQGKYNIHTGGNKLWINVNEANHAGATAACETDGARLVTIKNDDMMQAIKDAKAAQGTDDGPYYIGLTHVGSNQWRWSDGTDIFVDGSGNVISGYGQWARPTQWDGGDGFTFHPCHVVLGTDLEWFDAQCDYQIKSICECPQ